MFYSSGYPGDRRYIQTASFKANRSLKKALTYFPKKKKKIHFSTVFTLNVAFHLKHNFERSITFLRPRSTSKTSNILNIVPKPLDLDAAI